jgi:hypothetical protein
MTCHIDQVECKNEKNRLRDLESPRLSRLEVKSQLALVLLPLRFPKGPPRFRLPQFPDHS